MPTIDQLAAFAEDRPVATAIICVSALVVLVLAFFAVRAAYRAAGRAYRKFAENRPAEDILTIVAASIATVVSAQGMWQFVGRVIGDVHWSLRGLMFAFLEIAVVTSAVRAKRGMRENYSAGIDGMAVWALTSLSAALSALEAASLPEFLFRLAAPLVAAWLWERGMAIERVRLTGRARINWRISLERIAVYFGLAEAKGRTTDQVDVQRRLTRAAKAAARVRELEETGAPSKKQAKAWAALRAALEKAEEHTDLATNPVTQRMLLDKLATLRSGKGLARMPDILPWAGLDHPAVAAARPKPEQPGVHLLNAGLAKWSQEMLREPAEAVAARDRSGDQDATGHATTLATIITTPRRRIVGSPGSPWPVGRLVPFETWTRPEPRPLDDRFPLPPLDADPDAETDAGGDRASRVDATDPRPVADRKRPDEQDRKRAIRFYIGRAKKLNPPSKRTLADWSGFSETWALGCIQEGQRLMIAEGWTFDDRGTPTAPAPVADVVATASAEPSLNGSASTTA